MAHIWTTISILLAVQTCITGMVYARYTPVSLSQITLYNQARLCVRNCVISGSDGGIATYGCQAGTAAASCLCSDNAAQSSLISSAITSCASAVCDDNGSDASTAGAIWDQYCLSNKAANPSSNPATTSTLSSSRTTSNSATPSQRITTPGSTSTSQSTFPTPTPTDSTAGGGGGSSGLSSVVLIIIIVVGAGSVILMAASILVCRWRKWFCFRKKVSKPTYEGPGYQGAGPAPTTPPINVRPQVAHDVTSHSLPVSSFSTGSWDRRPQAAYQGPTPAPPGPLWDTRPLYENEDDVTIPSSRTAADSRSSQFGRDRNLPLRRMSNTGRL